MDFNNIHKFSELLDLHEPMKEVKDKLLGTYIELNGEIVLFADVTAVGNKNDVLVVHKLGSSLTYEPTPALVEKIESINLFLPEAGNYPIPKGGFINVQKRPNRQYARSLKLENYLFSFYTEPAHFFMDITLYLHLLRPENRETISVCGNIIYYLTTRIGYFTEKNNIRCTNEFFEQELIEWYKQHENK
jgi:hypothetical protein